MPPSDLDTSFISHAPGYWSEETTDQWNDYKWQLRHRVDSLTDLEQGVDASIDLRLCPFAIAPEFVNQCQSGGSLGGQRILNTETVELMLTPYPNSNISLIWFHLEGWIGHNGQYPGVATYMDFDPESGVGVVLLTNTLSQEVNQAEGAIYRLVHEEAKKYR